MRFATDASLGKLGRHLRAAGFDTVCQHQCRQGGCFDTIEADRIILTRTTSIRERFPDRPLVFIHSNDPLQQMIQVIRELDIRRCDTQLFHRCLACNLEINPIDRNAVIGRVPSHVWRSHQTFYQCVQCRRIFWAGSHHDRMRRRLETIFKQKEEFSHGC